MKTDLKNTTMELQEMDSQGLRRSGRTTRLADSYIQELFDKGTITVADHFTHTEDGKCFKHESKRLMKTIITRLLLEHNIGVRDVAFNNSNLTLTLKN